MLICIVLVVSFSSCGGVVKNADVKDDVDSSCGDVSLNPNSTYEGWNGARIHVEMSEVRP